MEMVGLGNLSPNLVMLGFKEKWRQSPQETRDYVSVILHALELRLSVALLRVQVSNTSRLEDGKCQFSLRHAIVSALKI